MSIFTLFPKISIFFLSLPASWHSSSSLNTESETTKIRNKLRKFLLRRPTLQSLRDKGYIKGIYPGRWIFKKPWIGGVSFQTLSLKIHIRSWQPAVISVLRSWFLGVGPDSHLDCNLWGEGVSCSPPIPISQPGQGNFMLCWRNLDSMNDPYE